MNRNPNSSSPAGGNIVRFLIHLCPGTLIFVLAAAIPDLVLACPNCKTAIAQNSDPMALGYAWSICWMMLAPLGILAMWAVAIIKLARGGIRFQATATGTPHG